MGYLDGSYWLGRSDLMYYKYIDYIMRVVGAKANSVIDVGSGNSPYLEWFDWIGQKVSIDIRAPYSSSNVQAITANILDYEFQKRYDICMCLQVLEHVQNPTPFARKLFDLSDTVVISIPYKWPQGETQGHVQDPVDEEKLAEWTGREPNYKVVVQEPFHKIKKGRRLIAVYDKDPKKNWRSELTECRRREVGSMILDQSN